MWFFSIPQVEPQIGGSPPAGDRDGVSFCTVLCTMEVVGDSQEPVIPSSPGSIRWCDLDFGESDSSDKNRLETDEEGATGSREAS